MGNIILIIVTRNSLEKTKKEETKLFNDYQTNNALYLKLSESKKELMVVDWYKDEQPRARVKSAIETSLDADLPRSYDKETFSVKIDLLLSHFIDMAVQGYGWVA